jgi:hypothetical protein
LYESGSTTAAMYVFFIATLGISIESTIAENPVKDLAKKRTSK